MWNSVHYSSLFSLFFYFFARWLNTDVISIFSHFMVPSFKKERNSYSSRLIFFMENILMNVLLDTHTHEIFTHITKVSWARTLCLHVISNNELIDLLDKWNLFREYYFILWWLEFKQDSRLICWFSRWKMLSSSVHFFHLIVSIPYINCIIFFCFCCLADRWLGCQ